MKISIGAVIALVLLVSGSLHEKLLENKNNNNIIVEYPFGSSSSQFTWRKEDLSELLQELRNLDVTENFFSSAVNLEKIIMKSDYSSESRNNVYYELFSQKIVSLVRQVEVYGSSNRQSYKAAVKMFNFILERNDIPNSHGKWQ